MNVWTAHWKSRALQAEDEIERLNKEIEQLRWLVEHEQEQTP